jgi:hypothetical protein
MATNSIAGSVLKALGISGQSGFSSIVPPPPRDLIGARPGGDQDFFRGGDVVNPNIWARYGSLMSRPTTYEQQLNIWEEMSGWDLLAAALTEIVDETLQRSEQENSTLWYECSDADVEKTLNEDLLESVNSEDHLPSQVHHLAALGNHFEKLRYTPGEGITGFTYVHPVDVRRYWLEQTRECIGFRWAGHPAQKEAAFVDFDGNQMRRTSVNDTNNVDELWYPWDFLHFRRMYRMRSSEHGEPLFESAQQIYKKIRLAIDQMVVHRAQVQPDRYAINIDVQELPPTEQMKVVQRWKQSLRSKIAFGQGGQSGQGDQLNDPTDFRSYYNALALDTILWVARPKGFQHSIEKIAGTPTVPDVYDIEMLMNLFFAIIGMPKWWLLGQADGQNPASGKALLATDARFLRKIKSIRRPLISGYERLAYLHALLKFKATKRLETLDINVKMTQIGTLEDQMRVEVLKGQAELLDQLAEVMNKYNLPRDVWIELVFKRYLHLPDDVVYAAITALPMSNQPREGLPAPTTAKMISEVSAAFANNPKLVKARLRLSDALMGKSMGENPRRKTVWSPKKLLSAPKINEGDLVYSSFGLNPVEFWSDQAKRTEAAKQQPINESVGTNDRMRPYLNW